MGSSAPASIRKIRTRSDPEQKRTQILHEAMRIIGEKGYNGFSIHQLAKRCHLTNAGLLHYFGTKQNLLIALLEERDLIENLEMRSLEGVWSEDETQWKLPRDRVIKILHEVVKRNMGQPEWLRLYTVLGVEALSEGHPAKEYFDNREKVTLRVLEEMVRPFVIEPASTARQLLSLMKGLELQWLSSGQSFDLFAEWERGLERLLPSGGG